MNRKELLQQAEILIVAIEDEKLKAQLLEFIETSYDAGKENGRTEMQEEIESNRDMQLSWFGTTEDMLYGSIYELEELYKSFQCPGERAKELEIELCKIEVPPLLRKIHEEYKRKHS